MDPHIIQLVARLKIRLRQDTNLSLNTQRFFSETAYARQILDQAEESEDIELVSLSMNLRDRLGWLTPPQRSNPPQPATIDSTPSQRYMFGARS